jgi:REP element-mobilizing transposase RayT
MGHPLRPDIRGAIYHLGSRGTNKEAIFFDDRSRGVFLRQLERAAARQEWIVLAYCLMTNHYHLVLKVPLGGLSKGMQQLNSGFSLYTNRRFGRTMHLFRQRFFSEYVESEEHLLEASRYTVLNPCRAGICVSPAEWPWSSYRSCAGLDFPPPFLAVDELLRIFGRDRRRAVRAYRAFVREGLGLVSDTETELRRDPH